MRHLAIPALAVLLLSPGTASAYQRDTHQHLVELAYGYLKLVDLCEPVPLGTPADVAQCVVGCRTTLGDELREQGGGYTCECVEKRCESRCGGKKGYAKYLCVNDCVERGPGFPCSQPKPGAPTTTAGTGSSEPQCKPPYFLSQVEGETIVEDACGRKCCEERALMPNDECKALCGVVGSDTLPVAWAKQAVEFYQGFQAPACPNRKHYQYHEEKERCAGDLTSTDMPLASWSGVPLLNRNFEAGAGYRPIQGKLLQATNPLGDQGPPDLTGTVIGLHTGLVDNLSDLHTGVPILPVAQDFVKTLLELTGGAFGLSLAAVVGAGGIVFCGVACPLTPIDCSDCFGGTYDAAKAIVQKVRDVVDVVEEQQFAVCKGPTTFGRSNSAMFHFMADPFFPAFEYDDVDGFRPFEAFGPGGMVVFRLHESLLLDQLFDVKVLFGESKRALSNYQPQHPDDGMEASFDRGVFYWHRRGMGEYTFPPADNMTYYWWHKWLEGRVANFSGETRNYSLLPLAVVLHGVQDLTQPFHTWGISLQGHADEESRIADTLDPASAWGSGEAKRDGTELLIDLNSEDQERLFLERVGQYLLEIRNEVLKPDEGVLHSRRLMHFLYGKTLKAQRDIGLPDGVSILASWWDYELQDQFLRETAIPLAVAATVTVLMEGAREDVGPYQRRLKLERDQFEREGDVPPITSAASASLKAVELEDVPPGFQEVYTEWACVGEQPRAQEALRRYVRNETSGRDLLAVLLAEKARCELVQAGLPVPAAAELDAQGRYEARQLEASTRWYSHGSALQLGRDLACNEASPEAAALVSPAEAARAGAVCAGTVDSDGDGVLDGLDRCWTPRALLDRGVPVRADGCAFVHEAFPEPVLNPFLPGAIRRRLP
jgi:hypothetical protein